MANLFDKFNTLAEQQRAAKVDGSKFEDRQYLRNMYQSGVDDVLYRQGQAPQAARTQLGSAVQVDPGMQAQFRDQQMAQAGRLAQIAQGQQQGAGELAAQRQANRAVAQQQAMARMGRGQPGMQRAAARNVADLGTSAAGQSQLAALQDQQSANNQLGQLLGQGRSQDQAIAAQNAQFQQQQMMQQGAMDQQLQLANIDTQLRAQGMDDQTRLAYLAQLQSMNQAELAAKLGQPQQQGGIDWGQIAMTAGPIIAAAALSDKNAKEDIRDGGKDVDDMLDGLKATTYRYRKGVPSEYTGVVGDGRRLAGIIAQDLQRSEAGRAIVLDTGKGLGVDMIGGISASLAGLARLNSRLRDLESKKG
jgi:hypothetical protein